MADGPFTHRLRRAHVQLAVRALAEVLRAQRPADAILGELFRAQRAAGSKDRANSSRLVYGVLRELRALQALAGEAADGARLCAAWLLRHGVDAAALEPLSLGEHADLAAIVASFDPATLTPAQRGNAPDWAYERWQAERGAAAADALATALNSEAPVDLRVNTLRATRAQVRRALADAGLAADETSRSPWGLRLTRRAALQSTEAFRAGWIEPQDEGSQLLALLVGAAPGERVVDFCAGAGGKTLALGAMMQDRGELHAFDTAAARLQRLLPRLERAGLTVPRAQVITDGNDPHVQALAGRCDAVLVDAPCSASGTWRRNPELRLRRPDFAELAAEQGAILERAATLPRAGGRLVYATCSLFAEENEQQIERFLASHADYEVEDAGTALAAAGVTLPERLLQLDPARHGTDGFFAARLRRRGA